MNQPTTPNTVEDFLPLPEHYGLFNINGPDGHRIKGYTADQVRAAILADRAQRPTVAGSVDTPEFRAAEAAAGVEYAISRNSFIAHIDARLAGLTSDLAECQASNRQAWGICDAVAAALGDDLDKEIGSAESIKLLRTPAAPVVAEGLTRYGWTEAYIGDDSQLVEDENGTYVKFADVVALLSTGKQSGKNNAIPLCKQSGKNNLAAHPVAGSPADSMDWPFHPGNPESLVDAPMPASEAASDAVHLIYYDDRDKLPEIVMGAAMANARFDQISKQWNAHLFGKLKSNSRDDRYYSRNIAAPAAPTDAQTGAWRVGNLLTMSDSDYPSMGSMFAQIWEGEALIARVYGDSADEVRSRASRVAAQSVRDAAQPSTQACFVCNGGGYRERHAGAGNYLCGQCQGTGIMPVIAAQPIAPGKDKP